MTDDNLEAALKATGLEAGRAGELGSLFSRCTGNTAAEHWRRLCALLPADLPFAAVQVLHRHVYAAWPESAGPPPAWVPDPDAIPKTNIGGLCRRLGLADYPALWRWSINDRNAFWKEVLSVLDIRFEVPPGRALAGGPADATYLPGAQVNIAASCFAMDADATAIVSGGRNGLTVMRSGELDQLSNRVANGLRRLGLGVGEAVGIVMPMTPAAIAAYLGCLKAGVAVVSVPDSFGPREIATRLRLGGATTVFTQSGAGSDSLLARLHSAGVGVSIVRAGDDGSPPDLAAADLLWKDFLGDETPVMETLPADAIANVLFSSGTTGEPKAIPWSHSTPIKCAADAWLHHDIRPGDVLAWPSSLGWMMGPWLIFAALMNRATIAVYDGSPASRGFGEFVRDAGVTMLGLVPSLVKSWRRSRCMEGLDWSPIRCFSSTGECSNGDDMFYLMMLASCKPVIEYCGGTEIGGGYITGTMVQPAVPATFTTPSLGLDFEILDEDGQPATHGEAFLVPPSIGLSTVLLNQDHHAVYFADTPPAADGEPLRRHGDRIERVAAACFRHHGRADDTMNLRGIKVSSAELERIFAQVPGVKDNAAVALPPPEGGPDRLIVYAVTDGAADVRQLRAALQQALRTEHSALFKIHEVRRVERLPRTASNKVMRRLLRDGYHNTGQGETP